MTIRVLINGAHGHMGLASVKAIANDPELEVVGELGSQNDLAAEIKKTRAQVDLDFTNTDPVLKNTNIIIESGIHPVIGTTGLHAEQVKELQAKCAALKLGGIIAPNFSLGAVLMMKQAQEIAKYF